MLAALTPLQTTLRYTQATLTDKLITPLVYSPPSPPSSMPPPLPPPPRVPGAAASTARSPDSYHETLYKRLDKLLNVTQPRKSVMLAIDGPAPLAKLMTQRERRKVRALTGGGGGGRASILGGGAFCVVWVEVCQAVKLDHYPWQWCAVVWHDCSWPGCWVMSCHRISQAFAGAGYAVPIHSCGLPCCAEILCVRGEEKGRRPAAAGVCCQEVVPPSGLHLQHRPHTRHTLHARRVCQLQPLCVR